MWAGWVKGGHPNSAPTRLGGPFGPNDKTVICPSWRFHLVLVECPKLNPLVSGHHRNIMKIKLIIPSLLVAGLFLGCASEKGDHEETQAQLMSEAKVTRADAERTALAKVPGGTIKEGSLEREKGKLIWSFDIASPGTADLTEVAVDALTGEIAGVEQETAKEEAKENKKEQEKEAK
jgi:hypothetical protein